MSTTPSSRTHRGRPPVGVPVGPAPSVSRRGGLAGALLDLQRQAGNRAVTQLVAPRPVAQPIVQRTLASDLKGLLNTPPVNPSDLASKVALAGDPDRRDAAVDRDLIDLAKAKLGADEFGKLLRSLQVQTALTGSKLSGAPSTDVAADQVQDELKAKFGKFIRSGAQGAGFLKERVVILSTKDFTDLAVALYPGKSAGDFATVSGFNIHDSVFVDEGKTTDLGTLIHEATHLFAPDDFATTFGTDFNEGATELFARKTMAAMGLTLARTKYQIEFLAVHGFAAYIGEEPLAQAYFAGDIEALHLAFVAKRAVGSTPHAAEIEWGTFKKARDTDALAREFVAKGMLSGEHAGTTTLLVEINKMQRDVFASDLSAMKKFMPVSQSPTMTQANNMLGDAFVRANEVYTGKKAAQASGDYNVAALKVEIEERQALIQRISATLGAIATLDNKKANALGKTFLASCAAPIAKQVLVDADRNYVLALVAATQADAEKKRLAEERKQQYLAKRQGTGVSSTK